MKPIIIEVSKDKTGAQWVTLTKEEFVSAVENAYEAGIIDGRKQIEDLVCSSDKEAQRA